MNAYGRGAAVGVAAALAVAGVAAGVMALPEQQRGVAGPVTVDLASVAAVPTFPPEAVSVAGVLRVGSPYWTATDDGGCRGYGYAMGGVVRGASVVVTDSNTGEQVGLGQLDAGAIDGDGYCAFPFGVPDVPLGHRFYRFEVTGGRNTAVQFREDQLPGGITITYS